MDLLTVLGGVTACLCSARYLGVVLIDTATELRVALRRWEAAGPPARRARLPSEDAETTLRALLGYEGHGDG